MASPPYSPGGRLIEWMTASSTAQPGGRGPKFGDSQRRACAHQPSGSIDSTGRTSGAGTPGVSAGFAALDIDRVVGAADVDAQAGHPVAHLAQRQPEARTGRGAVVAVALERAFEHVALDVVE